MPVTEFIAANAVMGSLKVLNKKQAFQEISARAAKISGLGEREIFDALWQREKLGSTGIGNGLAIPHCKLPRAGRIFGIFAQLDQPIDFDATDGAPVDLIFALIAPEGSGADHLKALSQIARAFRSDHFTSMLRAARDESALYSLITDVPRSDAA